MDTPDTSRADLYGAIHKALRAGMFDTLQAFGRLDERDAVELKRTLAQAETLMTVMAAHVKHENNFLHTAIEARRPGGSKLTADAHPEHLEQIAALRAEITALRMAPPTQRGAIVSRVYRQLALFVADNLEHMHVEETANHATLWALYRDDELEAIHDRLVASVEPQTMMDILTLMARALNPQELAGLLADMQQKAPPPVFAAVLAQTRQCLDDTRWDRLTRSLDLASASELESA